MFKLFHKILKRSFDYTLYFLALSFAITISLVRILVWMIEEQHFPSELYLFIGHTHIHHYTYGFLIISLAAIITSVSREITQVTRNFLAIIFGVGLALVIDEFGMWVAFNQDYWNLTSRAAILLTLFILVAAAWTLGHREKKREKLLHRRNNIL